MSKHKLIQEKCGQQKLNLSEVEWFNISELVKILSPFEETSKLLYFDNSNTRTQLLLVKILYNQTKEQIIH